MKLSFLLGAEPQLVGCPVRSLVTVPSALFGHISVLNKLNRVQRIAVVIMTYSLFTLVKFTAAFLRACNQESIPSHLNQVPISTDSFSTVRFSNILLCAPVISPFLKHILKLKKTHKTNWMHVFYQNSCACISFRAQSVYIECMEAWDPAYQVTCFISAKTYLNEIWVIFSSFRFRWPFRYLKLKPKFIAFRDFEHIWT